MSKEVTQTPQVSEQVNNLGDLVDRLADMVEGTEARLVSVLSPELPVDEKVKVPEFGELVPLKPTVRSEQSVAYCHQWNRINSFSYRVIRPHPRQPHPHRQRGLFLLLLVG